VQSYSGESSQKDDALTTGSFTAIDIPLPLVTQDRFAYATALWGSNFGFILGALVLGRALRRSGTHHDLVLLHTDDVSSDSQALLSEIWTMRRVEPIDAAPGLFISKGTRFDGVFTKLHVLNLLDYKKILMLDIDLTILQCPDALFDLRAPAALCRGQGSKAHGARIDGRCFFAGESILPGNRTYPWGQQGGINAGVMLLSPNAGLYNRAIQEVNALFHPERIPCAGPEQDYLSRLLAPWWTHISVSYNFQLHQAFFSLDASIEHESSSIATERPWIPERLALNVEDIYIVHSSGELKMWHRDLRSNESDDNFTRRLLRNSSPHGFRLWFEKQGTLKEYAWYGVTPDGDGGFRASATNRVMGHYVDHCTRKIERTTRRAVKQWREDLEYVQATFPALPPTSKLTQRLTDSSSPTEIHFKQGMHVEVYWTADGRWYAGTVMEVHTDKTITVAFDISGHWGTHAHHLQPNYVRPCKRRISRSGSRDCYSSTPRCCPFFCMKAGLNFWSHYCTKYLQRSPRRGVEEWRGDSESMQTTLPALPPMSELKQRLTDTSAPTEFHFRHGMHVEVYWIADSKWYAGTVVEVHTDKTISVEFQMPGHWGTHAHHLQPDYVRPR